MVIPLLVFASMFITGCEKNQEMELVDDLSKYHSWVVDYFNSTMDECGNIKLLNISIENSKKNRSKYVGYYTDTNKYKIRENKIFREEKITVGKDTLLLSKVLEMHGICNDYMKKHLNFKQYSIKSIRTSPTHYTFFSNERIYKIMEDKKIKKYHSNEFNGYVMVAYAEDEVYHFCF